MTISYLAGKRLSGLSTDEVNLATTPEGTIMTETDTGRLRWNKGGWKELGRISGSAVANLDLTSLANKRYLKLLYSRTALSATTFEELKVNNDSGTVYASRASENGGADFTRTSQTDQNFIESGGASLLSAFAVYDVANYSTKEKPFQGAYAWQVASGAGTAPSRGQNVWKWVNTTTAINRLTLTPQSGTVTGELVVLGWDPLDTHTSNFWEELASVTLGSTGSQISSGTFTAKKYLWIQIYQKGASNGGNVWLAYNGDTGANYASRNNSAGSGEITLVSRTDGCFIAHLGGSEGAGERFYNMFLVNNSANEKLGVHYGAWTQASGAGTATGRNLGVTKWSNTSNQITSLTVNSSTNQLATGSILKIWGAN